MTETSDLSQEELKDQFGSWAKPEIEDVPDPGKRKWFKKIVSFAKELQPSKEELDEIENKVDALEISRRDLLKGVAAGYMLAMTEPVNNALKEMGFLENGNLPEVSREVMESLVTFCTTEDENERKVAEAFLKFNAAIPYGKSVGMELAPEMISHFLYGRGEEFDISDGLLDVLKKGYEDASKNEMYPYKQDIPSEFSSNEEVLRFHTKNAVEKHINSFKGMFLRDEETGGRIDPSTLTNQIGNEVGMFGVVGAIIPSRDLQYSIGEYTLKAYGDLASVDGNTIAFRNPKLEIQDRYDWSDGWGLDVRSSLGDYARTLGVSGVIPEDWMQKLDTVEIKIEDTDGVLLKESGKGHDFDVVARYDLGDENLELNVAGFADAI